MNACGHHHVGHIGILGVDKNGEGGTRSESAATRERLPAGATRQSHRPVVRPCDKSRTVIERLIQCYLAQRDSESGTLRRRRLHRIGVEPFKNSVYGKADQESVASSARSAAVA